MFPITVTISIYALAIVSMFYMETIAKALTFFCLLLAVTFLLYLFISFPFPSAVGVAMLMLLSAVKI